MSNVNYNASLSYSDSISLGIVAGVQHYSTNGKALVVNQNTPWDLTFVGGSVVALPSNAGELIEVASNNVSDIETLLVSVLGPNGDYVEPYTIVLNGTTPVSLGPEVSRINSAVVVTNPGLLGAVTFQQAGGGLTFGVIPAGGQVLNNGRFTSPINTKIIGGDLLIAMAQQGNRTAQVVFSILVKSFNQSQWITQNSFVLDGDSDRTKVIPGLFHGAITGPFDVKLIAEADENNTPAEARFTARVFNV